MKEHITLGSSPVGEVCAQVGSPNYEARSIDECETYKKQLARRFEEVHQRKTLCTLRVKSFPHDFGSYLEVIVEYNPLIHDEVAEALWFEGHLPEIWDEKAHEELNYHLVDSV